MKRLMGFQLVLLFVLLLAVGLLAGPALAATYSGGDNGKTITVGNGETFLVRLDENPTTGYTWNMTVGNGLQIVSDRYVPNATSPHIVGSGGYHEWTIKAVKDGTYKVTGIYKRPWEPATGSEQRFTLTVRVVKSGSGFPAFGSLSGFMPKFDVAGFKPGSTSMAFDFDRVFKNFPKLSMFK